MSSGDCKLGRSCYRFLVGAWWGQLRSVKSTDICTDFLTSLPFPDPPPPPALNLCLPGTVSSPLSWVPSLHILLQVLCIPTVLGAFTAHPPPGALYSHCPVCLHCTSSSRCSVFPHWGFGSVCSISKQSCRAEAASAPVTYALHWGVGFAEDPLCSCLGFVQTKDLLQAWRRLTSAISLVSKQSNPFSISTYP